ncbi:hypothetical protein M1M11_31660 [Pseudomonas azerbaijanoccidens]|jgi:hypothetical protein|uniref:hypothetical protein n=1 Tax=Pseudomonas azerbaijanoccidentalis TaxID=2842347 RepID=UPI00200ADDFD|nr:hypothetical protein [Pseudomonas azerbaijanoccidentalis]MCK8669443.1 hypothetical protein [Pseudomonas azerbaijanoccidentalis]
MSDVTDFTVVDGLGNYDREANPQGLSVWELLPKEVSWSFLGRSYKIESPDKLIPQLLIDGIGIAVVVSPFNAEKNKALVVKPDGEVMWDVSARASALTKGGVFSDVYYVSGRLCFFVNINNQDFRFSFDVVSGEIGRLILSY